MKFKIGLVASAFDLFHAGHVLYCKEAKELCDVVIAALHIDPSVERPWKNAPIQTLEERMIQLQGCKYIDMIVTYNTKQELAEIIKKYKVDVWVRGSDHKGKKCKYDDIVPNYHFHDREIHNYSSSALRKRIYERENKKRMKI